MEKLTCAAAARVTETPHSIDGMEIFIVAPFVIDVRDQNKSKNPDGTPMRASVTCDGGQEQIKVFQRGDLLDIFSDALIDFGQIAASCSGIHQSSDVFPLFSAIKT